MQKRFKDILRSYLPELLNFFSQLDSKVLLELLSNFPSKQAIVKNEQQVIQLLTSFKNWNEQKAKAFVNAIKRSIGRKDKHQVAQTIILSITQQLKQIKEQIQSIDNQIKQMMEQFDQTNKNNQSQIAYENAWNLLNQGIYSDEIAKQLGISGDVAKRYADVAKQILGV